MAGISNEDFSEFVVECLEMCIVSVSRLLHHFRSTDPLDDLSNPLSLLFALPGKNIAKALASTTEGLVTLHRMLSAFSLGGYSYSKHKFVKIVQQ